MYSPLYVSLGVYVCECLATLGVLGLQIPIVTSAFLWGKWVLWLVWLALSHPDMPP